MSLRGNDWAHFQCDVHNHIENYTVPQYGDKNDDSADGYTAEDCVKQIKKYASRHGKNIRENQDMLDLIKIAHYAQLAYTKLQEQK